MHKVAFPHCYLLCIGNCGSRFSNWTTSIFLTRLLYADLATLCKSTHSQLFTFQPLLFSFGCLELYVNGFISQCCWFVNTTIFCVNCNNGSNNGIELDIKKTEPNLTIGSCIPWKHTYTIICHLKNHIILYLTKKPCKLYDIQCVWEKLMIELIIISYFVLQR